MREVVLPEDNSAAVYLRPSGRTEATDYAPSIWRDNCWFRGIGTF
jgi:hypothetical protein